MYSYNQILDLQRAQIIGTDTEILTAVIASGLNRADFLETSKILESDKTQVIGLLVIAGGNGQKSLSGKTLLSEAQMSTAKLHLTVENKKKVEVPLKMLLCDKKNLVYIPFKPFSSVNVSDCYILFNQNVDFDGAVEIIFITA